MKRVRLHVDNLEVDCIIGVWEHERTAPQKVCVDLWVDVDGTAAATSDALTDTVDYTWLAQSVTFILKTGHFRLLEAASMALHRWLLLPPLPGQERPQILGSHLRIKKYSAFETDAVAIVSSSAAHGDFDYAVEEKTWGSVDIVAETKQVGFYRLNITPGHELPLHYHTYMREQEWVSDGQLVLLQSDEDDRPLHAREWIEFPLHHVHGYRAVGQVPASLLCMDSPPFNHDDEILVTP
ncbi:MAG: dihydroneopterin aldolase [Myxococcota bacterium]|nr:dihydroneopterin aldolase [Myxococcota bacterium]